MDHPTLAPSSPGEPQPLSDGQTALLIVRNRKQRESDYPVDGLILTPHDATFCERDP
jgi:hypothetical protein